MIVARNGPIVIYPIKGVNAIMTMMAPNNATWIIPCTFFILLLAAPAVVDVV